MEETRIHAELNQKIEALKAKDIGETREKWMTDPSLRSRGQEFIQGVLICVSVLV